ncbi:hypothetical protein IMSHALPRED_000790 [Imshaugia aleurites]|uniref:Plastocyanin-like domain-containing protein n=1 Tax=Imshaugia aleurites TaxID=172621 RepID=A0A8H3J0G3_9LECA|nr:hypothetical protein IMSHALPRED_000790 [Imshaugia aleurites]
MHPHLTTTAFFNDITYVRPKVPTLYTALSAGELVNNATIYGTNSNPYVLQHNDIIEIIVNNNDTGKHPFHLHGHAFQAAARSAEDAGAYIGNETFAAVPVRRDTFMSTLALPLPPDHLAACSALNIPTVGNAAGNDVNFTDLTGAPEPPGQLPAGFTAKGVVAFLFSCLCAFAGIAVISWYGAGEIGKQVPGNGTKKAVVAAVGIDKETT